MAAVRCSTEAIGVTRLAQSWALGLEAHIYIDSSAALAICQRQGCGRLRHVRIGNLWIQERVSAHELFVHKVAGGVNPADMLTKGLPAGKLDPLMDPVSQVRSAGEAATRVQLHSIIPRSQLAPQRLIEGVRVEEGCLRMLCVAWPWPLHHRHLVSDTRC